MAAAVMCAATRPPVDQPKRRPPRQQPRNSKAPVLPARGHPTLGRRRPRVEHPGRSQSAQVELYDDDTQQARW